MRYPFIDQLRGLSVALMIIFHTLYNLDLFAHITIPPGHPLWLLFPNIIVTLFMLTVGISLALAHTPSIRPRPLMVRLAKISLAAMAISLTTRLLFPQQWVYFGALHNIVVCSLMALPFLKFPRLALGVGILLPFLPLPWFKMAHASMDYIPPFPWLSPTLLGIFLFHFKDRAFLRIHLPQAYALTFPGRHALAIYLIHHPLLYGLLYIMEALSTGQSPPP